MSNMTQTPKQQYEESLQAILQTVMEMPNVSDGDWKSISDHTSVVWNEMKEMKKMIEVMKRLKTQATIIEGNRYYRERVLQTPKTMMLTAQEKATSKQYTHCDCCKRIVKKSQLKSHQTDTKVCLDTRLALEMEKRYLNSKVAWKRRIHAFFEKHRKTYQLIHYFVKGQSELKDGTGKGVYDYYAREEEEE
jgi:hypothetical protein